MRTEVIITQFNYYSMDNNKGLSARVVGNYEVTNNKFGLSISEATITNFGELSYLSQFERELPAKFEADIQFGTKKSNGKEVAALMLSNLKFKNKVEFTDVKEKVNA